MATDRTKSFEIPEQVRDFTQKSVDQAKKAFDDYMTATQDAVARLESTSSEAHGGASELNRKILELAEENVASVFAHAQKLVKAKDLQEVVALQSEFLKTQMSSLGEQARVLSDATAKTAAGLADTTKRG